MKFRNPNTGEVFDKLSEKFCGEYYYKPCRDCPLDIEEQECDDFAIEHPHEAAHMMGYEVVEDDDEREYQEARKHQFETLYLTKCPECGSKDVEREPGTRHWTCHECGWENEPDRTAKADGGKPRPTLVPPSLMEAVTAVREYGCSKYHDPDNWRRVEPQRYRDALYRHWLAYLKDPNSVDDESGLPHLWHLACNVAFLIELENKP